MRISVNDDARERSPKGHARRAHLTLETHKLRHLDLAHLDRPDVRAMAGFGDRKLGMTDIFNVSQSSEAENRR